MIDEQDEQYEIEAVDYSDLMPDSADIPDDLLDDNFMEGVLSRDLRHDTLVVAKADEEREREEAAAKRASRKAAREAKKAADAAAPRKIIFGDAPVVPLVTPVAPVAVSVVPAVSADVATVSTPVEGVTPEVNTVAPVTVEPRKDAEVPMEVEGDTAQGNAMVTTNTTAEAVVACANVSGEVASDDVAAHNSVSDEVSGSAEASINAGAVGIEIEGRSVSTESTENAPRIDESTAGGSNPSTGETWQDGAENGQNELTFTVPENSIPTDSQTFENTPVLMKHERTSQVSYPCIIIERGDKQIELQSAWQVFDSLLKAEQSDVRYPVYIKKVGEATIDSGSIDASSLKMLLTMDIFSTWKIYIKDDPNTVYTDDLRFAFCTCSG